MVVEHDVDIDSLFESGNEGALKAYLRLLHPADIAELFNWVDEDHWTLITKQLDAEALASVLAEADEGQRERLGELLRVDRLITAVNELETDDAADVVADLPDAKSAAVLEALDDPDVIKLLEYPEDSAGGIMQTELCRVVEGATVFDAIEAVRHTREQVEDVFEVYVVDEEGRLRGTVALEDLVLSAESVSIDTIMRPVEHQVTPQVDQEEVAQNFRKYDLVTLPVVDTDGVLLGRITFDDIHDVLEEEASEDILTVAGTTAAEEIVYGGHPVRIAAFRLPWLVSSMLGSMVTGFVLSRFSLVPGDAIVLASFVPIIMAMTGNVGAQSAMIVMRGLATGKVDLDAMGRTLSRELTVGLLMGMTAGAVVGVLAQVWQQRNLLGFAVGVSMCGSMTVGALVGSGAPALFKKVGVDPALAAGPLVTATCDVVAVSVYLACALAILT